MIRIEDVSPIVPPENLTAIADVLSAENVPFTVSVIPTYHIPKSDNGPAITRKIQSYPKFVEALKYMQARGGLITMHGSTHQYGETPNPYNGESATDYEFFRVTLNSTGVEVPQGLLPEDSADWVDDRLDEGLENLKKAGFTPRGWVTPHYIASPTDYSRFTKRFDFSLCRALTFVNGADGKLYYVSILSPWVIKDDFGMKHVPETIGYVDPEGYAGVPPRLPADMVSYARSVKAVRDGWAGCYFHWFLDPSLLRDLVRGVKGEGFRFVTPSGIIR